MPAVTTGGSNQKRRKRPRNTHLSISLIGPNQLLALVSFTKASQKAIAKKIPPTPTHEPSC